jgi:hypothetical protein
MPILPATVVRLLVQKGNWLSALVENSSSRFAHLVPCNHLRFVCTIADRLIISLPADVLRFRWKILQERRSHVLLNLM